MSRSILSRLGALSRHHALHIMVALFAISAAFAWTGCGEEPAPSGPSNASLGLTDGAGPVVEGYDQLPPESQRKLDEVLSVLDDILSGDDALVHRGFERLDDLEPGLHDQVMAGLVYAFESAEESDGHAMIEMPLELGGRAADGDESEGPSICTKITIHFEVTIHKGSKITYKRRLANGAIVRHTSILHEDTVFTFDKVLEYECEGVEGCTITHTSDHETAVDEYPIKYESADNDGDGVADFVVDMKVSAVLKITVESKTCN
ncbi:MAG: hypothetical protein KDA27_14725 [Candidatus Eisenbacteria bacterium]|uniref:Uncharacterized protein n=1 Tax=Eiseniibacteriota bacterium TaxID=2212470 RepID=A0A956SE43_UNCEI|nr:hypothetical protein [Candidatus Eisenbacteria bacterium]